MNELGMPEELPLRISTRRMQAGTIDCPCCGRSFKPSRPSQKSCSRQCQLRLLAARNVVKAINSGRADGLRAILEAAVDDRS